MDGPKHRWFIVVGALLACGVLLLLGRQWESTSSEQVPAPAAVTATQVVEPEPETPASTSVETAPTQATPAPVAATVGTFRGRIIDAVTRQPVREFEVRLLRVHSGDGNPEEPPITQTFQSGSGRFTWNDLPAGTWTGAVSAHGYQRFERTKFTIVAGKKAAELVMPLLRGFTVRGRVFDVSTGAGIGDATVRFVDPGAWRGDDGTGPYAKSKEDGTFQLDGVPGGDMTLSADANAHASRDVSVFVSDATQPVDIGLSAGGVISGRVVNSAGAPIKGMVMLNGRTSGPHQTTQDGVFSFAQLPAGTYFLSVMTPVGAASKESIELAQDERRSDVTLTVLEGRTVRGTIRGLRPEQLKDATVTLRSQGHFNAQPDDRGAYALKGVRPGRALLMLSTRSRRVTLPIDVPTDRDLVFDFAFPPGSRLSGRVTQGGQPAVDKSIVVGSEDWKAGFYLARTSEDGQYEIEGVPTGTYTLQAEGDVKRPITLAGDTVVNIEIPLVQIGGRVLEDEGAVPIVGAEIFVRDMDAANAQTSASRQSDHFGEFQLTGLDPGEIQLTVYKPDYEMYREKITYSAPITDKTIRLRRGGGVEVRVQRTAKGEPEHGFLVMEMSDGFGGQFWVPLNRDGVGSMPSALSGSTLVIPRFRDGSVIQINNWDGSPLDLKF